MAISATTPINNYTGNGSVTTFTYGFRIIAASDLQVYLNGVLQTSGYTVTGVNSSTGGSVIFAVAPLAGVVVRLQRIVVKNRTTDYVDGGALAAQTLDDDFDRAVMQIQDLDLVSFKEDSHGQWNAGTRAITNVVDPVNPQDVVTKNYADSTIPASVATATTQATNSANSATASAASATASATSATNSANSATASAASATASANSASAAAASAASISTVGAVLKTSNTGSAQLPAGTTAQRDVVPVFGSTRANSDLNQTEWWNGTAWVPMGGGATGAVGNYAFFENDMTITANYTLTANKNAMTAGPITINTGVVVTVPSGATWSIV